MMIIKCSYLKINKLEDNGPPYCMLLFTFNRVLFSLAY